MFDFDKWQEIFNTIQKHKLRTFLTALGVFWGIFMLVFLMGSGKGLENGVIGQFGTHAKNALYVWTQRTTMPFEGLPPGRYNQLTINDIQAIEDNFPQVEYIAPRLFVPSGEIVHGNNSAAFDVRGERPDLQYIESMFIDKGRFINDFDLKDRRKVAVIGNRVREVLFEGEEDQNAIGKYVTISGADYLVVGVFKSSRKGENGIDDEQTIYMYRLQLLNKSLIVIMRLIGLFAPLMKTLEWSQLMKE